AVNAVAFPGTRLPRSTVTGPPVRESVLAVSREQEAQSSTRKSLGFDPARKLVVVTGGSLGAASINRAVIELCSGWSERSDLGVYHLVGERNLTEMTRAAEAAGLLGIARDSLQYRIAGFDPELPAALAAGDVVVARAGASTVAELAAIGAPSVLVPLPGAPSDHQVANAQALAREGAALHLPDAECTAKGLASLLEPLLDDPDRLEAMSRKARALGHRDAAVRVARLAESAARPARMG
ncbi:MAG: UDP-N-acetylglucosamine--N-acetylmuramyl-(pentapeptide) pyrophosphoryl-undecaprenol N-acetylglucosamine transferase, partial [Acidimicrobiales bacterium]